MGCLATDDLIFVLHLISTKCALVLLKGPEGCPVNVTKIKQLEQPVTNVFMKLLKAKSMNIVKVCQTEFDFFSVHDNVVRHKTNFLKREREIYIYIYIYAVLI